MCESRIRRHSTEHIPLLHHIQIGTVSLPASGICVHVSEVG